MNNERDDFWDLDKLVPKKKTVATPFVTVKKTVEHTIAGSSDDSAGERRLSFEGMSPSALTEDTVYTPQKAWLIRRVTIKRNVDKYDFYGSFRKAALIYFDYKTPKCDFTPFYSYMPQYSQLSSAQKNYYFYWRDEIRHNRYVQCDYSYLYLYVYEILNLPDKICPEEGIKLLCRLWREYRSALPRIDAYFSVWIQDYCLVYDLACPMEEIGEFIFDVIGASDFKEFYLSDINGAGGSGIDAMIAYLSDYDWRRCRYFGGDNAQIYKEHMQNAMRILLEYLSALEKMSISDDFAVLKRDAFPHSLCTHAVKSKLEIEYLPLSRNEQLRANVTSGVRYTENKLRALFGIKSRLAVKDFPDEYKHPIDVYFYDLFKREAEHKVRESLPEYEKLYAPPSEQMSFAGADEIERASWSTTLRLVENDELTPELIEDIKEPDPTPEKSALGNTYGLSDEDVELIRLAQSGINSVIDDSAMERINEAFADGFGDVILEFDGEKYTIIEDYKEDIAEWLLKLTK